MSPHAWRSSLGDSHEGEVFQAGLSGSWVTEFESRIGNRRDHLATERLSGGIRSETLTRSGSPAAEITAAAKESNVDLIVMATHGRNRSALEHLFLGSVAERVVRTSVCAVLVIPPT
jgi:nucleotide-binding universal stress UspA family protein